MAKAKSKMLRFTHINLEDWRNFTQVDVELQRRGFLIGPNASGKSTYWMYSVFFVNSYLLVAVSKRPCANGVGSPACVAWQLDGIRISLSVFSLAVMKTFIPGNTYSALIRITCAVL